MDNELTVCVWTTEFLQLFLNSSLVNSNNVIPKYNSKE